MLIALCGSAGSGKDTVATIMHRLILEHHSTDSGGDNGDNGIHFHRLAFAEALRDYMQYLNPWVVEAHMSYNDCCERIGYDGAKRAFPSIRRMLIAMGHGARLFLNYSCWVDVVKKQIQDIEVAAATLPPNERTIIIVTDLRYENEATMIKEMGGTIIRITNSRHERGELEAATLALVNEDIIIENEGTMEDLEDAVYDVLLDIDGVPPPCDGASH